MSNNNIPFRASRDRLIVLAPHLLPNPLPDLEVIPINFRPVLSTENLVVGSVEKGETALIHVNESQRGIVYQLRTADHQDIGDPIQGNCDRITFTTQPLTSDEWYEFYILATRPSTQVSKVLEKRIWINAGNIDGVDPSPLFATPKWEGSYTVVIPDTQPNLEWQLFHGNGDPASDPVDSTVVDTSDNSTTTTTTITLESYPLYENEELIIRVSNEVTEEQKNLSQVPVIKVFPNPNLAYFNNGSPLHPHWDQPVQVKVRFPQATVRYQLVQKDGPNWAPTGLPVQASGTELILTSGPLRDISTLRVRATKVDGNLEEYLLGELEIVVYPDPTLAVTLDQEVIDFGTSGTVTLANPQPATSYFLHLGDGVPISPVVVADDGNPISLVTQIQEEDITIHVNATRRNLSSNLDTTVRLFVRPNLDLEPQLPHVVFERADGTEIRIDNTQESVEYILYKVPGDWNTYSAPIECSRIQGNGNERSLPTGGLLADRYSFYVEARKENPLRLGQIRSTIDLEVSLRPETPVVPGPAILDYSRTTTLEIPTRQSCVNYRPVSGPTLLGDALDFREPGNVLHTYPLQEDTTIRVEAVHCLTMESILLDFEMPVKVGPNLLVEVSAPTPFVTYGDAAVLHFSDGQASVTYEINGLPELFSTPQPDGLTRSFSPAEDGPFTFPFGPLTIPMRLLIVARKTVTGMADALQASMLVASYPNDDQVMTLHRAPAFYGDTAEIAIQATDWYTQYRLQKRDRSELSTMVATQEPGTVILTTFPLQEDTETHAYAFSPGPGIGTRLRNPIDVAVPPKLNLHPRFLAYPFDSEQGAFIEIPDSQSTAQYRLEISEGDQFGFSSPQLLERRANGGGNITLPTQALPGLRYRVRVLAIKSASGLNGFVENTLEFYTGAIIDNPVSITQSVIEYDEQAEITIFDVQSMARYELLSQQGTPLSIPVETGDTVRHLVMRTFPLQEDQQIMVRVTNLLTNRSELLLNSVPVEVRPNPLLAPQLLSEEVAFNGYATLRLENAQKSVEYIAEFVGSDDPSAEQMPLPGTVVSTFSPNENGVAAASFGPLKYDQEFIVKAVKKQSRHEIVLPGTYRVKVGPDDDLEVFVSNRNPLAGTSVAIFLPRSQRGVRYRLRDRNAPPGTGFMRQEGFNHFNELLGVAHLEDDFAVFNEGNGEITLNTDLTTDPSLNLEVWAVKEFNGMEAALRENIDIDFQPI